MFLKALFVDRAVHSMSVLFVASIFSPAPVAHAAGFQIREQSALGLGRAYSGEVVESDDASSIWYNPAHAARLPRSSVTGTLSLIIADTSLENRSSILVPGDTPILGPDGSDPIDPSVVPALAAVWRPDEKWGFAVSVNAPFGLVSDYGERYFGRYDSTRSELLTLDGSVSVAYAISENTSIGVSGHLQFVEAELIGAIPDPLRRGAIFDGRSTLAGEDVAFGWSVGVVHDFNDRLSVGASYRSEVKHRIEGTVRVDRLNPPFEQGNSLTDAEADLTLPDSARLGFSYKIDRDLILTGQAEWVGWRDFDQLDVQLGDGDRQVTPFDYSNETNFGLGLDWARSSKLTLRTGVSWDPSPTKTGERSTRVPDGDRLWFSAGATRRFEHSVKLDIGAALVLVDDTPVATERASFEQTPFETQIFTRGDLESVGVLFSMALTKEF